ncbi:hypothetical protein FAK_37480 [Desulfoferula mesophila]|uniref:MEDS domain-containing protein n=1 Tax=Desulfoferula mesophila TaxID=3058419 RepID=A0AAU9F3W7_9BACT|nr:hypothetical protein FAK_37480 [Desulfoferula mesophilus]
MESKPKASPAPPSAAAPSRHLVLISEHPTQWRRVVRAFLREGLTQGEPCLFLDCLYTRPSVCRFLDQAGLDTRAAQKRGMLTFLAAEEMFNQQAVFSAATCLGALLKVGRGALHRQRGRLRVVADMNWAADTRLNHRRLLLYEEMLNHHILPNHPVDLLCLYDRALFPPAFLERVLALHQGQAAIPGPAGAGGGLPLPLNDGNHRLPRLAAL